MSCEVIIRYARDDDLQQRMELVRRGLSDYFWSAFVYFFFQELTLECCVLAAAVLFIFCGVSALACLMVVPIAAVCVALGVSASHHMLSHKQAQKIRREMFGLVAEVCGVLLPSPGTGSLPIHIHLDLPKRDTSSYSLVVGTVSVSEYWGPENKGWLHALVVHPDWRSRGVGASLARGARVGGAARGVRALLGAVSPLQPAAHAALAAAGWRGAGWSERALCGAALTLPLARLAAADN